MPQGTTYQDFLRITLLTVREPDYYGVIEDEPTFTKFIKLASGLSVLFQVKMKENGKDISHAYPIVGEGVTVYNPRKEEPTPVVLRPGILREVLKRVHVRDQSH